MKLQQLKRQLEREMKAHPGRAAALGLVVLVAGYMWAPLVWGAVAGGSKSPTVGEAPTSVPPPSTADNSAPAPAATDVKASWREIAKWMQDDPQMLPVRDFSLGRNPFAVRAVAVQQPEDNEPGAAPDVETIAPDLAGLKLSSTAVGSERRAAMINGQAYLQGERIVATLDGQTVELYLLEVHDRHVVLLHGNQQFDLKMESTALEQVGVEVPDG